MKKIKSFAKINLFLKVTGKQNKYHSLYSLVTQINLYDEVLVKENKDNKSRVFFSGPFKINDKNNSIIRILRLIKKKFPILKNKNFNIYVKKNIPTGSGLGGASSNATSIFNYFKKKYKLVISKNESIRLLSQIGKDCPLFIDKKVKLIQSSGAKFKEFNFATNFQLLLVYPKINLSTKKVFNNLKKIPKIKIKKKLIFANRKRLLETCAFYGNDLLLPALKTNKKLIDAVKLLKKLNTNNFYSMTGSGSAFFLISYNKKFLLNVRKIIKKQRKSFWTSIVKTI